MDGNNKIILVADTNDHTIEGKLLRQLKSIRIIDAYAKKFSLPRPVSHVTGSELIDGVWVTNNIIPRKVLIFPKKLLLVTI